MVPTAALDLAVLVTAGPIQHVERVGQVLFLHRPELKVDKYRPVRLYPVDLELEGIITSKWIVHAHRAVGGAVDAIGDPIIIVVQVKDVGRVISIAVLTDGPALRTVVGHAVVIGVQTSAFGRAGAGGTFSTVNKAVVVGVRAIGIAVPALVEQTVPWRLAVGQ